MLRGYWMDAYDNVINVYTDPRKGEIVVYRGNTTQPIGEIMIDGDLQPPELSFVQYQRGTTTLSMDYRWKMRFVGEMEGCWERCADCAGDASSWAWRRPAVFKKVTWPEW